MITYHVAVTYITKPATGPNKDQWYSTFEIGRFSIQADNDQDVVVFASRFTGPKIAVIVDPQTVLRGSGYTSYCSYRSFDADIFYKTTFYTSKRESVTEPYF